MAKASGANRYFIERIDRILSQKEAALKAEYSILEEQRDVYWNEEDESHSPVPKPEGILRVLKEEGKEVLIDLAALLTLGTDRYLQFTHVVPIVELWQRQYRLAQSEYKERLTRLNNEAQRIKDEAILSGDLKSGLDTFQSIGY